MELKYNRLDVFRTCKIGYLILGGLLLLFAFVRLFKLPVWMKGVTGLLSVGILAVFIYHIVGEAASLEGQSDEQSSVCNEQFEGVDILRERNCRVWIRDMV